jgi:hypothetical protein
VIWRALAKDPEARYPSAGDLGRAALAAARGEPVTESERSVARGSAAPEAAAPVVDPAADPPTVAFTAIGAAEDPATAGTAMVREPEPAADPRDPHAEPAEAPERHAEPAAEARAPDGGAAGDEAPAAVRLHRRALRRPRPVAALTGAVLALAALGVGLGLVLGDPGASAARTGPLSRNEVRSAAQAFADAYSTEDQSALRRSLSRAVLRVLPTGVARGREDVVAQYASQFDGKVRSYTLSDLQVSGGSAGRASGEYRVERAEGDPIEGHIVFSVVRERGQPRIGLIAATPRS